MSKCQPKFPRFLFGNSAPLVSNWLFLLVRLVHSIYLASVAPLHLLWFILSSWSYDYCVLRSVYTQVWVEDLILGLQIWDQTKGLCWTFEHGSSLLYSYLSSNLSAVPYLGLQIWAQTKRLCLYATRYSVCTRFSTLEFGSCCGLLDGFAYCSKVSL